MKLTQTALAKLELPAGSTDKIFFDNDLPGFGVRIREGGSRKYVVHYRIGRPAPSHDRPAACSRSMTHERRPARCW